MASQSTSLLAIYLDLVLPPDSSGFLATAVADTLLGCLLAVGRVYHLFLRHRRELWAFTPTRFTSSN